MGVPCVLWEREVSIPYSVHKPLELATTWIFRPALAGSLVANLVGKDILRMPAGLETLWALLAVGVVSVAYAILATSIAFALAFFCLTFYEGDRKPVYLRVLVGGKYFLVAFRKKQSNVSP